MSLSLQQTVSATGLLLFALFFGWAVAHHQRDVLADEAAAAAEVVTLSAPKRVVYRVRVYDMAGGELMNELAYQAPELVISGPSRISFVNVGGKRRMAGNATFTVEEMAVVPPK